MRPPSNVTFASVASGSKDVGDLWLWTADGVESIDFKHYRRQEDLIGDHPAQWELQAYSNNRKSDDLMPPCLRPGFKE